MSHRSAGAGGQAVGSAPASAADTHVVWSAPQTVPEEAVRPLPAATRRVLAALRAGASAGMFPPVLALAGEGVLVRERQLGGQADAALLGSALGASCFAPLHDLLEELDAWCATAAARHTGLVAPGVLTVTNAALFGPLAAEVFTACAAGGAVGTGGHPALRAARFTAFLDVFLDRLADDVRTSWFDSPSLAPPVIAVTACGAESHNGGQRVLRLCMAGGGRVAYKPRPAGGERLFLARGDQASADSVFALLNTLPAASGPVLLPTLACRTGRGPDAWAYSWQEWVERPPEWGVIRRGPRLALRGTRLTREAAPQFWHRAGSLAAAAFAFGISDLSEGNLLTGANPAGEGGPLLYPVDLEVHGAPVRRLYDTGLVADPVHGDHHHPGLEDAPRWCTLDGPVAYFDRASGGGLRLCRRDRPCARETTRSVVSDTRGATGYAACLPAFLRGMFDAWTLLCRHRRTVADFLGTRSGGTYARVLPRTTAAYTDVLDECLLGGTPGALTGFTPAERAQLERRDVPYFYRSAAGGPLLALSPPPDCVATAVRGLPPVSGGSPATALPGGRGMTVAGLGVALRDAVEYAFPSVGPGEWLAPGHGVELRIDAADHGEVRFAWTQVRRRFCFAWHGATARLSVDPLPGPPPERAPAVRSRLLRLDRVDAGWRAAWVASGFADRNAEEKLRRLTGAGLAWLADVVHEHGWPGRALVGARAADAACRLVQHAQGNQELRRECLELARRAAAAGDLDWRQIAYMTDALRLAAGRHQLYGTKFRAVGGRLEPCPIEWPETVDDRRRLLGMEPLRRYAARLRKRYPHPSGSEALCTPSS